MASGSASSKVYAPKSSVYPYMFNLSWNETGTDKTNNTSSISVTGSIYGKDIYYSQVASNPLKIYWYDNNNNSSGTLLGTLDLTSTTKGTTHSITKTITATHKNDGTLSGYAKLVYTKSATNNYAPPTTTLTTSNTALTTIPRESSMSFGTGTIGSALTLSIKRNSDSYTHKITYAFGSLSGTIATGVGENYSWTIPTTFYGQLSSTAKYGTGTLYLTTYSGSTQIGDTKSYSFTAYCNESACKPNLSGIIKDINDVTKNVTGSESTLVDYKSIAQITLTYSAKNGATIKKVYINNASQNVGTTYNLVPSQDSYSVYVEDSRGYQSDTIVFQSTNSSGSNYFKRIKYIPLTISPSTKKPNQTDNRMQVDIKGNYFSGAFSDTTSNELTLSWKCREKGTGEYVTGATELNTTITDGKYEVSSCELVNPLTEEGTWDYQKSYEFLFTAVDKIMSINGSDIRPKGQPDFGIFQSGIMFPSGIVLDFEVVDEW